MLTRPYVALAGLVLVAAFLRVWGLSYGLPHPLARPDEEIVVGHALELSLGPGVERGRMPHPELLYFRDPVRGRTIQPRLGFAYPYPDLVYDMDAAVFAAWRTAGRWTGAYPSPDAFIEALVHRRPGAAYLVARAVGAICGTATTVAVYFAAWWMFRRRSIALLAALLVAVNFLHARDSHYATVDVPMTLLVTLALAFAGRAVWSERRRDVLWSAGFVGLAASAKFNGAVVALSTAVAAALAGTAESPVDWRRSLAAARAVLGSRRRVFWTLVVAAAVAIGVFAVTSPWCIRYYKIVHLGLRTQRRVLFGTPGPPAAFRFLTDTLPGAFGWPAFLLALVGVGRACWRRRPVDLVLLAFLVPAFASMAGITWVLPRYPVPLLPALAIFAAEAGVGLLAGRLRWWGWAVVLAALAVPPLARIVAYDRLASRPDTRLVAAEWIASHLPEHARVAVCRGYGAPVVNSEPGAGRVFDRVDSAALHGRRHRTGLRAVRGHLDPSRHRVLRADRRCAGLARVARAARRDVQPVRGSGRR